MRDLNKERISHFNPYIFLLFCVFYGQLGAICNFSPEAMRLYTVDEWLELENASPEIEDALRDYHATAHYKESLQEFVYNPEGYFNKRIGALKHLLSLLEPEKRPNQSPFKDLKQQAENKYSYLLEVPKELNPSYIKSFVLNFAEMPKDLMVRHSYWFETLDPLHRAGPEIEIRKDGWEATEIPSFFIFLETIEYNPGLCYYVPYKHQVAYFNESQKNNCLLKFLDGKIYLQDKLLDTSSYTSQFPGVRKAIYVLGKNEEFYLIPHLRNLWQHSTAFSASPVIDAGEIKVVKGQIVKLCNKSGHYAPTKESALKSLEILRKKQASLEPIELSILEFDSTNKTLYNRVHYHADDFLRSKGTILPFEAEGDWKPIHIIAWNNDTDNFSNAFKSQHINKPDKKGNRPLHLAIMQKNFEIASLLLEAGADPQKTNKSHGNTPLHLAVKSQQRKMIQLLLEAGADPTTLNDKQESPLLLAAKTMDYQTVDLLLSYCPRDFLKKQLWSILSYAIQNKSSEIYNFYSEKCSRELLFSKDAFGNTLLHFAAAGQSLKLVKQLINEGFSLDEKNNDGEYPLHFAATQGAPPILSLIIKYTNGAHVNKKNNRGETPLIKSICNISKPSLFSLIEYGADLLDRDEQGMTALHRASLGQTAKARRNLVFLLELLNQNQMSISTLFDKNGHTPIHLAILNENYESTLRLLALSNSNNIKDNKGLDLIFYASQCKNQPLNEFLIEKLSR